ncbi:hypothetical protein F5144DRAFT_572714, partial [Chaetomium tenue]
MAWGLCGRGCWVLGGVLVLLLGWASWFDSRPIHLSIYLSLHPPSIHPSVHRSFLCFGYNGVCLVCVAWRGGVKEYLLALVVYPSPSTVCMSEQKQHVRFGSVRFGFVF